MDEEQKQKSTKKRKKNRKKIFYLKQYTKFKKETLDKKINRKVVGLRGKRYR